VAALSARSVFTLDVRFEQLLIEGAHIEVRRDATGRVFVAGARLQRPGQRGRQHRQLVLRQPEFVIRGGSLTWIDEQRDAAPLSLADMQLIVRNGLRSHEIRLDATPPAEWGERFSLQGRFTHSLLRDSGDWRHWSGTAHAELPRADVRRLRRHVKLPFDLAEGDGAVRAWLQLREGQPQGATVDVALREVTLRLSPMSSPSRWRRSKGAWSRSASTTAGAWPRSGSASSPATASAGRAGDLSFAWRDAPDGTLRNGEFNAERLDLALMAQIASRVPLGDAMRKLLAELHPRGVVSDLTASWQGALDRPAAYQVKGVLTGLWLAGQGVA
jgi:uncharacterized protein YhdP